MHWMQVMVLRNVDVTLSFVYDFKIAWSETNMNVKNDGNGMACKNEIILAMKSSDEMEEWRQ